ncbi:MAG: UDP-N-acetylglucosamine 1-carboxyvinyltransferase [Patescibacteria group bacterium]|jgi:UDP-N-acetylglucosamine 1-carboxyvinyltransferase
MSIFKITGGIPLTGRTRVAGAKNAATKLMVATLLTDEPCRIEYCPHLGDTEITIELIEKVGGKCQWEGSDLHIQTAKLSTTTVSTLSRKNRIPILALAPLLHRGKVAQVPVLGGDKIGPRPVDFHINALINMGAQVEITEKAYLAKAEKLVGKKIILPFPSVGATETILFASVLAEGKTRLENAAIEPEVIELVMFLQKMGAIIHLGANRVIEIEGVKKLHGATHRVGPDRNEVVSFACAAIGTNGDIFVEGAEHLHLISFLNVIRKIGAEFEVHHDGIRFWNKSKLNAISITTDTHPGFMTDWQQPVVAVLTQAQGTSLIHETIYEDRFSYTKDLNNMGAKIEISSDCQDTGCRFFQKHANHVAKIQGPTKLKASTLTIPDIRAGIAHVIAALIADGTSTVNGIEHLDRGYEKLEDRLKQLGADINRID